MAVAGAPGRSTGRAGSRVGSDTAGRATVRSQAPRSPPEHRVATRVDLGSVVTAGTMGGGTGRFWFSCHCRNNGRAGQVYPALGSSPAQSARRADPAPLSRPSQRVARQAGSGSLVTAVTTDGGTSRAGSMVTVGKTDGATGRSEVRVVTAGTTDRGAARPGSLVVAAPMACGVGTASALGGDPSVACGSRDESAAPAKPKAPPLVPVSQVEMSSIIAETVSVMLSPGGAHR